MLSTAQTGRDPIRLNRLDADIQEKENHIIVRHWLSGQRRNLVNHIVWRRTYQPLDRGGFGLVFREECIQGYQKGAVRAVKKIGKPNTSEAKIDYGRELEAIAKFSKREFARFFVQSFGWYESDTAVYIAMELIQHGNLQQYIGNGLPEKDVRILVSQVLHGLDHMHAAGYAHRDLKPQNLLVVQRSPKWHIKIADFGLSKHVASSSLRTGAGTAGYIAPELLGLGQDDDSDEDDGSRPSSYTNAVDIWAVGVIAFVLLVGALPFTPTDYKPLKRYVQGKSGFPNENLCVRGVSTPGISLIHSLLAPVPSDRPGASSSLDNRWFHANVDSPGRSTTQVAATGPSPSDRMASWATKSSEYQTTSLLTTRPIARHDDRKGFRDNWQTIPTSADASYQTASPRREITVAKPCPTTYLNNSQWIPCLSERPHWTKRLPFSANREHWKIMLSPVFPSRRRRKMQLSPDGKHLFGFEFDEPRGHGYYNVNSAFFVNVLTTQVVSRIVLTEPLQNIIFSPDSRLLVIQTRARGYYPYSYTIRVYRAADGVLLRLIHLPHKEKDSTKLPCHISISAKTQRLMCIGPLSYALPCKVLSWNTATWKQTQDRDVPERRFQFSSSSANGRFLVGYKMSTDDRGYVTRVIEVLDAETLKSVRKRIVQIPDHGEDHTYQVSCDGALVSSIFKPRHLCITYDTYTGEEVGRFESGDPIPFLSHNVARSSSLIYAKTSPNGRFCAMLLRRQIVPETPQTLQRVVLACIVTGKPLIDKELKITPDEICWIEFSLDSSMFMILENEVLYTWQLKTGNVRK